MRHGFFLAAFLLISGLTFADGPADNNPNTVRPVPPPGIAVPEEVRLKLKLGVEELGEQISELRKSLAKKPALLELLPDVEIYYNSIRYALKYNEFYGKQEFAVAEKHLKQGLDRAASLRKGDAPWNTATGPVVRGYRSKIDGSVQPYGLVVPKTYSANTPFHHRLDLWFHGRGERLTELSFIEGRQNGAGDLTPANAFVLHPYGRYCNANHFAGEIDTFEAIEHARKHYPIDVDRISVRGYSMGGAACWGFAVHYPGLWAAAQPGAGFSETPEFLRVFQQETIKPNAWEKKLLHWYDCTDWAGNLYNLPTVAFSNEKESQRQAADIMGQAMLKEGLHLTHILAPGSAHRYPPPPKEREELFGRIDSIVKKGRDPLPRYLRFTTYTLRYNSVHWLTIDGLEKHWEPGFIGASVDIGTQYIVNLRVSGTNVTAFTLSMPPGHCPFRTVPSIEIAIGDGEKKNRATVQTVQSAAVQSDLSWVSHFRKIDGKWKLVDKTDDGTLRKRHGLQGPIDDAFMDTFVMVKPTGTPINDKVGKWIDSEMNHAVEHWRKQFRGEITPIDDTQVDAKMIANSNLVLWGDPESNKVLAKIADKLPIKWDAKAGVLVDGKPYAAGHHVPVLIYPNPLNPKKYVVLNSGFTFREYDYLNNARQIPRLPDWAVLDIDQPRTTQRPAGIVDAGFFGERWELK